MTLRQVQLACFTAVVAAKLCGAATCDSLKNLSLPNTTITIAQSVAAGESFLPVAPLGPHVQADTFKGLPAFCRVAATLSPSSDSDIRIEVWMPLTNWNNMYQAVGNGGWAGQIHYADMAAALRRGYSTSGTDTGHRGADPQHPGAFALGHPEKVIDYGSRSAHEMAVRSKAIINAYYGKNAQYSYWVGCSMGGRQGLREAQSYPSDFDGIISGAAGDSRTHLAGLCVYVGKWIFEDQTHAIPASKLPMIHQAVLNACDALDGVKDGLLEDPQKCKFDFKVLQCKGEDLPTCLTATQVQTAQILTSPAINSKTGEILYPGYSLGSELGWETPGPGHVEPDSGVVDQFRYIVFKNPNWDWRTFDLERDVALADKIDNGTINAINPDLTAFKRHGGKLLIYHGWADPGVPPLSSVNYYSSVLEKMGAGPQTDSWVRLFMVPGMGHCRGGEGPDQFDMLGAMEKWVEEGKAPERIIASHVTNCVVDFTRPLCPFPKVATFTGSGSTDDAANFTCK
jgi:feruloyl esterase